MGKRSEPRSSHEEFSVFDLSSNNRRHTPYHHHRYVVHSGPIPNALLVDDNTCCNCVVQDGLTSPEFQSLDPNRIGNVEFYHEKLYTNGINCGLGDQRCPCCCFLPYLETMDPNGRKIGASQYICDACLFVPKVDVFDEHDRHTYR